MNRIRKDVLFLAVVTFCLVGGAQTQNPSGSPPKNGIYVMAKEFGTGVHYDHGVQAVYWVSQSAPPLRQVLITGAFDKDPKSMLVARVDSSLTSNEISHLATKKGTAAGVQALGATGLLVTLPRELPEGPYAYQIRDSRDLSIISSGLIDQPEIWWVQGLSVSRAGGGVVGNVLPGAANAGQALRCVGRSLGKTTGLVLQNEDGKRLLIAASSTDQYSVRIQLPVSIPSGKYQLTALSRAGKGTLSSVPIPLEVLPLRPRNVVTKEVEACHVVGDGITDNAGAFQRCLDGASPGVDTIFVFGSGDFVISGPLRLRENEYIAGVSRNRTRIIGKPRGEPPKVWITATRNFGFAHLSIQVPLVESILVSDKSGDPAKSGHVSFADVAIIATSGKTKSRSIWVSGPSIYVDGMALEDTSTLALSIEASTGVYIRDLQIKLKDLGWILIQECQNLVYEESTSEGLTTSLSNGRNANKDFFFSRNKFLHTNDNNREAITADGGGGAFVGHVRTVDYRTLELVGKPDQKWTGPNPDLMAVVISGTGLGQYRHVTEIEGSYLRVAEPWQIRLQADSIISVCAYSQHFVFSNNFFEDTGPGIQLYGKGFDTEIANNTLKESWGIIIQGIHYFGGWLPCVNVEVLGNDASVSAPNQGIHQNGIHLFTQDEAMLFGMFSANNNLNAAAPANSGGNKTRIFSVVLDPTSAKN
jgi:hypothetical protein